MAKTNKKKEPSKTDVKTSKPTVKPPESQFIANKRAKSKD